MLDDEVLARAYGLVLPINVVGIVAGSLSPARWSRCSGLQGALIAAGLAVLVVGGLLLRRPLAARPLRWPCRRPCKAVGSVPPALSGY